LSINKIKCDNLSDQ